MKKYIIFRAEGSADGWKERKLEPSGALTRILAEHIDCSDKPLPEPGYRPAEFVRVDQLHNPSVHGDSTHYRTGEWEVVQVHSYTPSNYKFGFARQYTDIGASVQRKIRAVK